MWCRFSHSSICYVADELFFSLEAEPSHTPAWQLIKSPWMFSVRDQFLISFLGTPIPSKALISHVFYIQQCLTSVLFWKWKTVIKALLEMLLLLLLEKHSYLKKLGPSARYDINLSPLIFFANICELNSNPDAVHCHIQQQAIHVSFYRNQTQSENISKITCIYIVSGINKMGSNLT